MDWWDENAFETLIFISGIYLYLNKHIMYSRQTTNHHKEYGLISLIRLKMCYSSIICKCIYPVTLDIFKFLVIDWSYPFVLIWRAEYHRTKDLIYWLFSVCKELNFQEYGVCKRRYFTRGINITMSILTIAKFVKTMNCNTIRCKWNIAYIYLKRCEWTISKKP